MNSALLILTIALGVLSVSLIFILMKKTSGARSIFRANQEAKELIDKAKEEVAKIKREASIEAKEKYLNLKSDFERQTRERRRKFNEMERRLVLKEENLERKYQNLEKKERDFSSKEQRLYSQEKEIVEKQRKYEELTNKALEELERIANISQEEAKRELQRKMEEEAKLEASQTLRNIEEDTREKGLVLARDIISQAIQRSAAEHVVATTVSVVDLPSDDMKGRII